MNKRDIKQTASDAARDAARKAGISQSAQVLNRVPELIEAVEIDSEYIRTRVEAELNKKTGNPINAILRLLGLRMVSTRNPTEALGLEEEDAFTIGFHETERNLDSMLKINERTLACAASRMADDLAAVEAGFQEERKQSKSHSGQIFAELDKKTQECAQLTADMAGMKASVLEHTQYMLSLLGPGSDSPILDQLVEMLEDMGVSVYWTGEDAPFSDSAMFTELKCDKPETRRAKPCLASGSAVLVKGLHFVPKA